MEAGGGWTKRRFVAVLGPRSDGKLLLLETDMSGVEFFDHDFLGRRAVGGDG